jgi:hypothetical protein
MNPGACGHNGWHLVRTLLRFTVEGEKISGVQAIRQSNWVCEGDDEPPATGAPVEPLIGRCAANEVWLSPHPLRPAPAV